MATRPLFTASAVACLAVACLTASSRPADATGQQPPGVTITVINITHIGGFITYWPDQCNRADCYDGAPPQTYVMPFWVRGMSFLANGRTERVGIWPGCTVTFMVAPNGAVVASVQ